SRLYTMEFVGKPVLTAMLQLLLSLICLLYALVTFITTKLQGCCPCPCPCHRDLEEELEKERTASASAVEQAMAMISRLQKEKASLEMDARQFRRLADQRQLYDLQAINLLKEVVLKFERERYAPQQHISFSFPTTQDEDQRPLPK
ncbi:hypothetical protein KI387_005459, partial [Taxus chinensis]